MPNSNDAFAAIATDAAVNIGNAVAQGNLNRKNRKFAKEMYETQKADNLAFWNMQNEYNLPANQMQRFKDAGLNPNLIYGQTNQAGPISTADFKQPQTGAPQFRSNALQMIDAISNLEVKQAQTDNLKAQNSVILQDAVLRAAQIADTQAGTRRKDFDLGLDSELRQTSADARKELLRQMQVNTDVTLRKDVRDALITSSNLEEANERIQNLVESRAYMKVQKAHTEEDRKRIRAQTAQIKKSIDIMMKEGAIKDLDVELARAGVRTSDPIWYRSIGLVLNSLIEQFFGD